MSGAIAMGTNKLTNLGAGTTNGDSLRYEQLVGQYLPLSGGTITGAVNISNATASTSTSTGALVVAGGVGVAGAINVGGGLTLTGTGNGITMTSLTQNVDLNFSGKVINSGNATNTGDAPRWDQINPAWTFSTTSSSFNTNITATTTAPVASGSQLCSYNYRQIGYREWQISLTFDGNSVAPTNAGSGDFLFLLPGNLTFLPNNDRYIRYYTGNVGTSTWENTRYIYPDASGVINDGNTAGGTLWPVIWANDRFRVLAITDGGGQKRCVGSAYYGLGSTMRFRLQFRFYSNTAF
jgi:hypothetical protein